MSQIQEVELSDLSKEAMGYFFGTWRGEENCPMLLKAWKYGHALKHKDDTMYLAMSRWCFANENWCIQFTEDKLDEFEKYDFITAINEVAQSAYEEANRQ